MIKISSLKKVVIGFRKIIKILIILVIAAVLILGIIKVTYKQTYSVSLNGEIIGYSYVHMGKMMDFIKKGLDPKEAIEKASGKYGRFDEAVKKIDPRAE